MQNISRDYPTYSPNSKIQQSRHEISPFGKRNQSVFVAREKEQDKQHKYFQNSKVESCSFVFVKGGSALAMPYYSPNYLEKHNSPSPSKTQKKQRSISTVTQESYAQKQYTHAGQRNKPMEPYHMNAQRNRLIIQEPKIARGNSSSIMFGDPLQNKKIFKLKKQTYLISICINNLLTYQLLKINLLLYKLSLSSLKRYFLTNIINIKVILTKELSLLRANYTLKNQIQIFIAYNKMKELFLTRLNILTTFSTFESNQFNCKLFLFKIFKIYKKQYNYDQNKYFFNKKAFNSKKSIFPNCYIQQIEQSLNVIYYCEFLLISMLTNKFICLSQFKINQLIYLIFQLFQTVFFLKQKIYFIYIIKIQGQKLQLINYLSHTQYIDQFDISYKDKYIIKVYRRKVNHQKNKVNILCLKNYFKKQ
ncbi:hypothetical protein TTHERM_00878200 (macronuclear) [Tetrahymena thermophila SB210]|uniref:Uncharacterized protein n=1 Tax=Tetrahymena thermophila (strain SB210) TaxID=312017 RepID=Q23H21_TETTS|nr:hypothetical protein TTHERM_00878200 [Tetrahymena thermophila SB210]EAR95826.2 hypothetical protein TTHERM_00878200 [Tetrahymena thermophila SB210]|eukprot:XP_001016071.2 hypothetical protein TTHERM_00878200 [Tetrahymena thermophila SB210]